jgi:hypothetical protein
VNGADGSSDIEGKAAMVAASERGSERVSKSGPRASADQTSPFVTSVNGVDGICDVEGKGRRGDRA